MDLRNFVGGEWTAAAGEHIDVKDPATDEVIYRCPASGARDVDDAVSSAVDAFGAWRRTPVPERADVLIRYYGLIRDTRDEIAEIITRENGKTLGEARGEMRRALEYVQHACAAPELTKGSVTWDVGTDVDTMFVRDPLGVFGVIAPYNFPAMIPLYFVWAVASGATVVVKPSELCPNTSVKLIELAEEAGFPPGVVNLVLGGREASESLVAHDDVAGVTFVGSSEVARAVYEQATSHGKRAQAQGGAKNHLYVTDSMNMDRSMENLVNSMYGQASQRCFAGSNVLIDQNIADQFMDRFTERVGGLRVGAGTDDETDLGPIITSEARDRYVERVNQAEKDGAKVLIDGRYVEVDGYPNGYFLGPTLVEASPGTDLFDRELFGPVRCVLTVDGLDEAVDIINRSDYGHTAAIYTDSGSQARRFMGAVNTGQVGVNVGTPAPIAFYAVGGRKASFYGDLRGRSTDAVDFYTDKKAIVSTWPG